MRRRNRGDQPVSLTQGTWSHPCRVHRPGLRVRQLLPGSGPGQDLHRGLSHTPGWALFTANVCVCVCVQDLFPDSSLLCGRQLVSQGDGTVVQLRPAGVSSGGVFARRAGQTREGTSQHAELPPRVSGPCVCGPNSQQSEDILAGPHTSEGLFEGQDGVRVRGQGSDLRCCICRSC